MSMVKKCFIRLSTITASLALILAIATVHSTCFLFSYQPEVPEKLKKHD